jgi:hypothetical protein
MQRKREIGPLGRRHTAVTRLYLMRRLGHLRVNLLLLALFAVVRKKHHVIVDSGLKIDRPVPDALDT